MRKRLAKETVRRRFKKMGFEDSHVPGYMGNYQSLPARRVFVNLLEDMLTFKDARWSKRSNVHVVSYWHWPSTLAELEEICAGVKETYSELCETKFNEE